MHTQDSLTQLTFHFVNGQTESFNILQLADDSMTPLELQQEIRHLLDKPWWILHLPDQTVCIKIANVVKVEVKPSVPELQGEGVFSNARRVTALTRTAIR